MASAAPSQLSLTTEAYQPQMKKYWPKEGRHILAQYDDSSVVVYQAYNRGIANYAVEHQRYVIRVIVVAHSYQSGLAGRG